MEHFTKQCKICNKYYTCTYIAKLISKKALQNNNLVDKTKCKLYNHGQSNLNILSIFHCQLRNSSSSLNADL